MVVFGATAECDRHLGGCSHGGPLRPDDAIALSLAVAVAVAALLALGGPALAGRALGGHLQAGRRCAAVVLFALVASGGTALSPLVARGADERAWLGAGLAAAGLAGAALLGPLFARGDA